MYPVANFDGERPYMSPFRLRAPQSSPPSPYSPQMAAPSPFPAPAIGAPQGAPAPTPYTPPFTSPTVPMQGGQGAPSMPPIAGAFAGGSGGIEQQGQSVPPAYQSIIPPMQQPSYAQQPGGQMPQPSGGYWNQTAQLMAGPAFSGQPPSTSAPSSPFTPPVNLGNGANPNSFLQYIQAMGQP